MKILKLKYSHLIITFIFSFIPFVFLFAQSNMAIQWQSCYGGSDYDLVWDIVQSDSGYLVLGESRSNDGDVTNNHGMRDIWIVSIDSLGGIIWERCYGGSNIDFQGSIISDFEGSYYFCGVVFSNDGDVQSGNHGNYDTWVVKIDSLGDIIWEKCYGGGGYENAPYIMQLKNGNLLISCNSTSNDGDLPAHYGIYDNWLLIISPQGEILQNKVFGNSMINNMKNIIKTKDGGYFFVSSTNLVEGMVEGTYHGGLEDVWVVKLDSNMNIEWQKLYGGSETDNSDLGILELQYGYIFLAQTNSNDGDVSGYHGNIGESADIWVVRIDIEGNIIWQRCLGGLFWEGSGSIHKTEDGGFVIFGETQSNNGDVSGNYSWSGYSDIWMVKLSANGELEWQECFGGYGNERIYNGAIKKSDDNWIVAGRASNNSFDVDCNLHGAEDFWVFEILDTTGVGQYELLKENMEFEVYPNPAKDYVCFEYILPGNKEDVILSIKNMQGIETTHFILHDKKGIKVWDTRGVKQGVYFYSFKSGLRILKRGKVIIIN